MSQQLPSGTSGNGEKGGLRFHFVPREALAGEWERLREENPHAKAATFNPTLVDALRNQFGEGVQDVTLNAGEHTVFVSPERIVEVLRFLKDEHGFTYLAHMGTHDRFTEDERFEVFYGVVNIDAGKRLRIKVRVEEDDPVAPTVTDVYKAANWYEREAWDMMGIRFDGHPDPRRVFMPEDFEHHPHRKEFPTLGIPGSLPLPPGETDGEISEDPFPRAHGKPPVD